ncbi:MAG TPA: chromosome segregation protein SMC [Pyrinomonadaceae bacterium]|nr:chromosome segregation protein SMC [Pyrinomonadaceae bacterium]
MFRLQRLEISGFKSFADYTDLVFTGSGITGVVGPNGCGKSNVADAIAWVLGEQRVKQLRGAEMKDVIFQGSRNRLPSGMAEVVLHLVRDETVEDEDERDVDDIDSALQEIDDQTEAVEEKLAPAIAAEESHDAAPAADALQPISQDSIRQDSQEPSADAPTGDTSLVVADAQTPDAATPKVKHKRHWRPRRMELDFAPGETVTVTRRLYRSGESEYLLNGRVCRLRDIQDLFSGTGLSGAHYAIIEQGRIGQILSAKPMDRRTLIEEAAGITKFRVRQRAAEARLDGARQNLSRVSDIISEIDRQVNSLRRQAAKARRYQQLREDLRELLRRVYVADERSLNELLEDLRARLSSAAGEVEERTSRLEARAEESRRATADARAREDELAEARAAVAESALVRDRRERERAYQEEQAASIERRIEEVRREAEGLRARLAATEREGEGLRLTDAQLREASEETARLLEAAEAAYAQRVAEVAEAESVIETARAELLTHTAVVERLREIGRQLETALAKMAEQAEGLAREGERARAAHAHAKEQAARLGEEIRTARARLDALTAEREQAARSVAEARAEVSETAARHERVRDESARVRHRLDTLDEIDAQRSLYSQAVQRIFGAPQEDDPAKEFRAIATLADVLRVEPHWEPAVESVFGAYLQSVIVPTPDDALRAAGWLRAAGAGRATFLVAGQHGGAGEEEKTDEEALRDEALRAGATLAEARAAAGGQLRVWHLLGAPREIAAVLRRALPREMNALVADDIEQATELSLGDEEMCVTPEGEWAVGGQILAAGGPLVSENGAGLLAFKREMRELGARAVGLEADLVFAEEAASSARARLGELEDAFVLLNDAIGREEREQVARELNAAQLAQEIERTERHMRVVADDAARLAEEQSALQERRDTHAAEADAAESARLAATASIASAADTLASARRAAEEESERLSAQRAAAAAAAERRRATTAEMRRMESESGELRERLARHTSEAEEMSARLAQLRHSLEEFDESAADFEGESATLSAAVEMASARLTESRERADALAAELTELHQRASDARDARASLEVRRAETGARLSYLRESCMSELGQPLEELAREQQIEEGFDLEASRARVEEMRARLESFGAVNMMALEELAENEERLQFLTTQRQDIIDGIASTEEALREIKRRSRERFRHAFEEINRNFGQFFQELFGGGRGEMSLIDADDVLESGIDIVAQPPGKRLQNVLLLSGGEKAMAALALVLSIFRYHPSPFCLLDEVDAPLDEANIGRFTTKITEMSENTQFIVITHNKRTMEVARALYGVTMEEAGVSKLVSVRFE